MAIVTAMLANASTRATAPVPIDWPAWIIAFMLTIGMIVAITTITAAFAHLRKAPPPDRHDKFVVALTKSVRKHTDRLDREFAELLRVPPAGSAEAQAFIRNLRRLLREPMAFIAHARTAPLGDWPSFELSTAFADWSGVIEGMDSLLADMFIELNTAVVRSEWGKLHEQYQREEWYVRRDAGKLKELATAIDRAARPFFKKGAEDKKAHGDSH